MPWWIVLLASIGGIAIGAVVALALLAVATRYAIGRNWPGP